MKNLNERMTKNKRWRRKVENDDAIEIEQQKASNFSNLVLGLLDSNSMRCVNLGLVFFFFFFDE